MSLFRKSRIFKVFLTVLATSIVALIALKIFLDNYQSDVVEVVQVTKVPQILPSPTPTISETKLILTGDVMLGRKVMIESIKQNDYKYPFLKVADFLKRADIVFINLENPIVSDCPIHEGGFTFCSPSESVEGLTNAGVDVVNLANNHSGNYGVEGIEKTSALLQENGIETTGLNNLVVMPVNDLNFGFLGFDYVFENQIYPKNIQLVTESKPKVDILIVAVHWGDEYTDLANSFQRQLAKNLIANGADVVVGHHPHWVQDAECFGQDGAGEWQVVKQISKADLENGVVCPLNSKPVFYSLGNFIFDQMWSEETKKGAIVELTFKNTSLESMKEYNTYIGNWGQVELLN